MSSDTERAPAPFPQTLREQVAEFMTATGQPVYASPFVPNRDRVTLRLKLIAEEFLELVHACDAPGFPLREAEYWIKETIAGCGNSSDVDLVEVADALADLDYVVEGTRLEFGIDGAPIAAEVQRSNMSKLVHGKPVIRESDGKVLKGPNFSPPDIESELRRQGWAGGRP